MLSSVLSPASYSHHDLSGSLYALVIALATGYAAVLLVTDMLDRESSGDAVDAASQSSIIAVVARNRWFWIPPLYILALLLAVVVTHTRGADAAQFMYRKF
jgi:hypothetical protein